jgi:hypothetical protein
VNNALQAGRYNVTATAARLGLTRMGLTKKIKVLGIALPSHSVKRFPKRMGRGNKASIEVLEISPRVVDMRGQIHVRLKVTNTGRSPWLQVSRTHRPTARHSGSYTIVLLWVDDEKREQYHTTTVPLPGPVQPGQTVVVDDHAWPLQQRGKFQVLVAMSLLGVGSFVGSKQVTSVQDVLSSPDAVITIQ